jgi:hypothetical protein
MVSINYGNLIKLVSAVSRKSPLGRGGGILKVLYIWSLNVYVMVDELLNAEY